ncbi:Hpt domain-containing protein, partial [Cephalotus follicularis]
ILDKQFVQLEKLEEEDNPNFVEEVITLFFRDSTKIITTIEQLLEGTTIDSVKLDKLLHQIKGSSASIGANKVRNAINQTRELYRARDMQGASNALQRLKMEHDHLRARLEPYFQLLRQVGPVETAVRPK